VSVGPIHHVAIVVRSIDEALPRYRELFGLEPEAPPMTFAPQRVRLCFLPTGPEPSARIELVEPVDDESGVARYLASHGEGVHHVCLVTDDLPHRPRAAPGRPRHGGLRPPTHAERGAVGALGGRSSKHLRAVSFGR
jgi:methylmalonyl-CoA epimerase